MMTYTCQSFNVVRSVISSGSKEGKKDGNKDGDQMKAEELRQLIREVLEEQEQDTVDNKATKLKTGSMSASSFLSFLPPIVRFSKGAFTSINPTVPHPHLTASKTGSPVVI